MLAGKSPGPLLFPASPRVIAISEKLYWYAILTGLDGAESLFTSPERYRLFDSGEQLSQALSICRYDADPIEPNIVSIDAALVNLRGGVAVASPGLVLDAWNSLDEVCEGCGCPLNFRGDVATRAYNKLFWGLNLPSVTPAGRHFEPVWRRSEGAKLVRILRVGASRVVREYVSQGL